MNYGTLIDNALHPAPRAIRIGGAVVCNPRAEDFARLNVEREAQGLPNDYPISDDPAPTPPEGKDVRFNGYAVVAGWIAPQYSFEDAPPPPPRVWTPLAIKRACGDRWATVKAALQQVDIYEDFIMAQELREDDAAFAQGYNWAVSEFGAEVVDAVLAAAEGGV